MVAAVYIGAGVLELFGLLITILDLRAAQTRLAVYFARPHNVYATDSAGLGEAFDATVVTTRGESPTLEQRVDALEARGQDLSGELDRRDARLLAQADQRLRSEISATADTLNDRLEGVREYVIGEPGSRQFLGTYRGPLLLIVGVLLGTVGNLMAL